MANASWWCLPIPIAAIASALKKTCKSWKTSRSTTCFTPSWAKTREPNPKTFNVLQKHVDGNPQFNIIPYNYACTPENKKYTFNYSDPNIYDVGMNGGLFDGLEKENEIKQFHNHKIEVDGVNITDFLNQNHNDLINKIKFDLYK